MKCATIWLVALCTICCSLAAFGQQKDDLAKLIERSDLIVAGTVLDVQPDVPANGRLATAFRVSLQVDQMLLGANTTPTVTFLVSSVDPENRFTTDTIYDPNVPVNPAPVNKGAQVIFFLQKGKYGLENVGDIHGHPLTDVAAIQGIVKTRVTAKLQIPGGRLVFGEATKITLQVTNPSDTDVTVLLFMPVGFYFAPKMEDSLSIITRMDADPLKTNGPAIPADMVVKAKSTVSITYAATVNAPTSLAIFGKESCLQVPAALGATLAYTNDGKKTNTRVRVDYIRILVGYPLPKVDANFNPIPDEQSAGDTPAK